jgi:hypothetical protein
MSRSFDVDPAFASMEKQAERLISKSRLLLAQRDLLLKAVTDAAEDLRLGKPEMARAGLVGALLTIAGDTK